MNRFVYEARRKEVLSCLSRIRSSASVPFGNYVKVLKYLKELDAAALHGQSDFEVEEAYSRFVRVADTWRS